MLSDEDKTILRELTHELRRLRHGELVARLAPAEIDEIVRRLVDRLDEREHTRVQATPPTDTAPRRAKRRGYF